MISARITMERKTEIAKREFGEFERFLFFSEKKYGRMMFMIKETNEGRKKRFWKGILKEFESCNEYEPYVL